MSENAYKKEYILAPSILAADFKYLGEQIHMTEEWGAKYLHFDVMDGTFVHNISLGIPILQSVETGTNQVLDVHLMIREPIRYVEAFEEAGADILTVHYEACQDVHNTLRTIRECGVKASLSICPETPVRAVEPYLEQIDMLLVMGVSPGFGAQPFLPETLGKIREARALIDASGLPIDLQVDGGIHLSNLRDVLDAGANVIVSGSAIFNGNPAENTREFMEIINSYG